MKGRRGSRAAGGPGGYGSRPKRTARPAEADSTAGACRLVGESYQFRPAARLVLTADNHNSVNGLREFARARGAATRYIGMLPADLRTTWADVAAVLESGGGAGRGLFAYPAQSNFSGIGIDLVHRRVSCLTSWLLDNLVRLKHGNGAPMVRLYGPGAGPRRRRPLPRLRRAGLPERGTRPGRLGAAAALLNPVARARACRREVRHPR